MSLKQSKWFLAILVLTSSILPGLVPLVSAATGTIDAVDKYAWSENIGWINFGASSGNIIITDSAITGYAWSANYGWINMAPPGSGVVNNGTGVLSGYAWGENTGYINFSGVTIDGSGYFQGYALGDVTGGISFNCANTASCGSSDFKVRTDWVATPGGGGGSNFAQQGSSMAIPTIGPVEVISTSSVRYTFTYNGSNQDGFRLLNAQNQPIVQVPDRDATTIEENNLSHNTLVHGRKVVAYNGFAEGSPSSTYEDVYTHIIPVTPIVSARVNDEIHLRINESLNNLVSGQTGIQAELTAVGGAATAVQESIWTKNLPIVFSGTDPAGAYNVRVRARNADGVVTAWSAPIWAVVSDQPVPEPEPIPEPSPEPTEPAPVPAPTPEEVDTIEQVLTEEFPRPLQPRPQPVPEQPVRTIETVDTITSFDGESFNVSEPDKLAVTGFARTEGENIIFTGTTTEPFTVVTLIINDSITFIATSNANGDWSTFVDAESLGIQPGEERLVRIEVIAAKGDTRSERVTVGEITVLRSNKGQVIADFQSAVSENPLRTVINQLEQQFVEAVQEQEPVIQGALVVSAPILVASSVPLWGYLPYVPTLIYHFIAWLFGVVNRKKKDDEHPTFGVVYDAITKQPVPLAIVRVYNSVDSKLAATIVTDKLGRYDTLLAPGSYRFEVAKPLYQFPSNIVTGATDGAFDRVYQAKASSTMAQTVTSLPHIPIDPINAKRQWELSFGFRKAWLAFQRLGNHLATPIMLVGLITALALIYANPERLANWIVAGVYAVTLAMQLKLKPKIIKAWGVVYDIASNSILPLVTIQLIEPASSKVVTSRLSDYEGRFTFLPEPGTYVLKASKPGFNQVTEVVQTPFHDRQPLPQTININKPSDRVSGDVAMKQAN